MKIVATFSFNGGDKAIIEKYREEFEEIKEIISNVDANNYLSKKSKEKTKKGKMLYSPRLLNQAFKEQFNILGWHNHRENCNYIYGNFLNGYIPPHKGSQPFRDMDFVKPNVKLGVEVQFGKYAFMVYNVCAKMTIFRNKGIIDTGIEIVPVKHFADNMSSGVSYFEQIAWDLSQRGISNIDVPVLIVGIDA